MTLPAWAVDDIASEGFYKDQTWDEAMAKRLRKRGRMKEEDLERDHQFAPTSVAPTEKPVDANDATKMRTFDTGATRDSNADKFDYKGFLSPLALEHFAAYMHKHRKQADGTMRASDNWKKGIPISAYLESLIRHSMEFWRLIELGECDAAEEIADAMLFNLQGFLHERVMLRRARAINGIMSRKAT